MSIQQLLNGVSLGSVYALIAVGFALVFNILKFSNFAHGDTMAIGTAFVILVTWGLQAIGISLWPLPTALSRLSMRRATAEGVSGWRREAAEKLPLSSTSRNSPS